MSTMSSGSPMPTGTHSPVPTPSPTGNSGGQLPGISRSSSLLFGFLITFLALFVAFMGCGLGSRRALDVRRRRLEMRSGLVSGRVKQKRPHLWDVWIAKGASGWIDVLPLSVSYVRPQSGQPEPEPTPDSVTSAIREFPIYIGGTRGIARIASVPTPDPRFVQEHDPSYRSDDASLWLPEFIRRRMGRFDASEAVDVDQVSHLRVAVVIAMPSPHSADVTEESGKLGEYSLGVFDLPWENRELG